MMSFIIYTVRQIYYDHQIKENEMGKASGKNVKN
jgi:hypothetical protein